VRLWVNFLKKKPHYDNRGQAGQNRHSHGGNSSHGGHGGHAGHRGHGGHRGHSGNGGQAGHGGHPGQGQGRWTGGNGAWDGPGGYDPELGWQTQGRGGNRYVNPAQNEPQNLSTGRFDPLMNQHL